jgi:hypothetical protein
MFRELNPRSSLLIAGGWRLVRHRALLVHVPALKGRGYNPGVSQGTFR